MLTVSHHEMLHALFALEISQTSKCLESPIEHFIIGPMYNT